MKRFLSAFIAILLVVSMMPLSAFAADTAATSGSGAVAKIGDKEYSTLAEAIKAAPKNTPTTISLLMDCTIANTMAGHQYVQNITIDLNGYTLSSSGIALTAYRNGTTLTVKNGTVLGNSSSGTLRATYSGKLILGENLTVKGAGGGATLVYVDNGSAEIAENAAVNFVGGKVDFKVSDNVNNKLNYAAKIGRTYFGSFANAYKTAVAGDTITLLANLSSSAIITIDKAITLDGNGKTLTSTAGRAINVSGANGVTIKNLTIDATGERAINIIQNATNVAIENMTATSANYTVNVAASAPNAVVTINGSTLTGLNVVNVAAEDANVTINDGTINCNDNNANENYAALSLNKDAVNGKITANGVTFDVKGDSAKASNQAKGGVITIDGSTNEVSVDVAYISYGNYWNGYTSLKAAIDAAKDGDTIVLLKPIVIAKGETLKLDKKVTITYASSTQAHEAMITNNGTLIVDGAELIYTYTGTGDPNFGWGSYTIYNNGNLTVNSGKVEFVGNQPFATHCSLAIFQYAGSTTINGGSIINNAYRSVRLWKGDMTINGGTFEGQVWVHCVDDSAKLTINGGSFAPAKNGGDGSSVFVNNSGKKAELFVTGGSFATKIGANDPAALNGPITGGTFTEAAKNGTNAALLGENMKFEANENGTYGVVAAPVVNNVAQIGTQGYKTLAEALAAAKNGDTITFVADINENVTINKAVTIDGAYKTYTGNMQLAADTTIKNVHFDGKGYNGYAVDTAGASRITIENCTAKNYGYGLLQSLSSNEKITVKNVEITGVNYGIKINYSNAVELENVTIIDCVFGVMDNNYGSKVITLNNCDIEAQYPLALWDRNVNIVANFKFIGDNTLIAPEKAPSVMVYTGNNSLYAIILDQDATLKATKDLNVSTVDGYEVVYENGTYITKELVKGLKGSGTEADPYQIGSVEDLIMFRDSVNAGETKYNAPGVYVALTADIDLKGINWVGIGSAYKDHGFMGNFDGKTFKIKNLTITDPALDSDGYAYAGLFSVTEGTDKDHQNTIKNLTIENVSISTNGHIVAAAIAYPYYTIVENVTVCGNINITGGDYTAGALAYTRRCVNASNVTVSGNAGSTITGRYTVGGVISDIQMNGGLTANYSNFSVKYVKITGKKNVGGISGIIAAQTLNGASVKYVEVICNDARVGSVSGSLGATATITNATVSGVEINGKENGAIIGGTYDTGAAVEAKVGDTYYASFAAALKAAETRDTITLLNNVTLTDKEAVVTSAGVKALLNVSGKSLTLDLNGKTIYLENNSAELIYAGIFVDKDAALTVKDSVGNGGIRAEKVKELTNGKQDIGYMIFNYSTTTGAKNLIIEGGNFYANNVEDSIVYSQGDETVVIKGGFFKLDAVGTRKNGHPWIFNAKGQNTQNILVEGGTFNADVVHQYWIFEVEMHQDLALKYDATNKTYTVVPSVAYVTERHWSGKWYTQNIGYATIEEAIAACEGPKTKIYYNKEYVSEAEEVVLRTNVSVNKTITIANGQSVVINLNKYTISGAFSNEKNQEMFLVKGNLTVKNGNIEMIATNEQNWNAMSTVFDVTAGGVLNIDNAFVEHKGGTAMNFCVHLNNWGEVTLNVTNDSTLKATYIPVRVFNSGNDMNNVTIKASLLEGKYCLWVHNYTLADFGTQEKVDAHKALLNFDFYGAENGNTFAYTNAKAPVIYGFTDSIYATKDGELYDEAGNRIVDSAEDLMDAVENGDGNIKLDGDIDLNDLLGSLGG